VSWIDEVKSQSVLELATQYTTLKRGGRGWRGACPVHKGEGPNFSVDPSRNSYTCFVCGEWGSNPIDLLMKVEGLDFMSAAKQAAAFFGITVPERGERRRSPKEVARLGYQASLATTGASGWGELGMDPLVEVFSLGTREEGGRSDLLVPLFGGGDVPRGWVRYEAAPGVEPRFADLDERSEPDAGTFLFGPRNLRTLARTETLLVLPEPLLCLAAIRAGYASSIAPALPRSAGEALLGDTEAERLVALGVRQVAFLVPPVADRAARGAHLRSLFASEAALLERGIEPLAVSPGGAEFDGSPLSWLRACGDLGALVPGWLNDNERCQDLFQWRVDLLLRAAHGRPERERRRLAAEKLGPSLRAAARAEDPTLHLAYVAWVARALELPRRGDVHNLLEGGGLAEAAEVF
jgi:hypothetical protein